MELLENNLRKWVFFKIEKIDPLTKQQKKTKFCALDLNIFIKCKKWFKEKLN